MFLGVLARLKDKREYCVVDSRWYKGLFTIVELLLVSGKQLGEKIRKKPVKLLLYST